MTSRLFAASIVLLGIGSMVAPVATSAGAGGLRPSVAIQPSVHTPLQRGMTGVQMHTTSFRIARQGDHRGPGFPLWWGYAPDATNYYPSEYAVPYEGYLYPYAGPYMENFSERSRPVVIYQPGCRTDTQTIPSKSDGEHTITITRCY